MQSLVVAETRDRPDVQLSTHQILQSPPKIKQKKQKYHAINSVYYILSIQVYTTFLSIHVHTVIHIVIFVSFSLYFFH